MFRLHIAGIAGIATLPMAVAWPAPEHFVPMITACEGVNTLGDCSAAMTGTCKAGDDSERFCGPDHHGQHHDRHHDGPPHGHHHGHEHHDGHHERHHHGDWPHHHHHDQEGHPWRGGWHPVRHMGDCASKSDGDSCTVSRPGQCVPSGKCPIFQGQTVCRRNDARPPPFVTAICEGRTEGDDCEMHQRKGKCHKPQFLDFMICSMESDQISGIRNFELGVEVPQIAV